MYSQCIGSTCCQTYLPFQICHTPLNFQRLSEYHFFITQHHQNCYVASLCIYVLHGLFIW